MGTRASRLWQFVRFSRPQLAFLLATVLAIAGLEPILSWPWYVKTAGLIALGSGLPLWYLWWNYSGGYGTLTPVREFQATPKRLIFTYGSLLVRDSILRTIAQGPGELECIPCRLRGFRLSWGAPTIRPEFVEPTGRAPANPHRYVSLVIERGGETDTVDGAVIGLTREDYLALKGRETSYRLADVTSHVTPVDSSARLPDLPIETFVPSDESPGPGEGTASIRRRYLSAIGTSLRTLGFAKPSVPPALPIRDMLFVNEILEPLVASRAGETVLRKVHQSISRDMSIRKEHRDTAYTLRPVVLARPVFDQVQGVAEAAVSLSVKALRILDGNHDLARWAGYTDDDLALLKFAADQGQLLPQVVRVDLALQGHRLRVFEVNADSPGGMRHLDIVSAKQAEAFTNAPEFEWIDCRTYDTGRHTLEALLAAVPAGRPCRSAAILEHSPRLWPTYPEMQYFEDELRRLGLHAELLDAASELDALEFVDGALRLRRNGRAIDLVYKRMLWTDTRRSHPATARALTDAYLSGATTVVNSLGSRMAGNKMFLAMMKAPEFPHWLAESGLALSAAEQELIRTHIPGTFIWGATSNAVQWSQPRDLVTDVLDDSVHYVLKSYHGFGGDDVLIGAREDRAGTRFLERLDQGFIVQEHVAHGRELVPVFRNGRIEREYQFFILGAYVIGGRCVAVEAKTSPHLPINMGKGAFRTAVFPTR